MGLLNNTENDSKTMNRTLTGMEPGRNGGGGNCKRTIYTAGRPPWYTAEGQLNEPFLIGICGGSASGKTTVAQAIIEHLAIPWVSLVCMDSFYKVLTIDQLAECHKSNFNFDHPSAFDTDLILDNLQKLKKGHKVDIPIYDFTTHSRLNRTKTIYGANVIIFEGILSFITPELRELMDLKVFVDTDADDRLARRLLRDITERKRDLVGVMEQYSRFVKPSYDQFIAPCMEYADIIVPRGGQNHVAIGLIVQHVTKQLHARGSQLRHYQAQQCSDRDITKVTSLSILRPSKQVRVLQTLIRNRDTPRDEFIFYSDRLMRILCEFAMTFLPYKDKSMQDGLDEEFGGRVMDSRGICGVSILRAGETMENALRDVCKDVQVGKILIQTNPDTQEPELHYCRLPSDIKNHHVIVMDPTVASGAAAVMAIRVILEHEVPEQNIVMMSLLMAEQGVKTIAYNYPQVKILAAAVDKNLSDSFHIIPGFGNFGNRYFGTDDSAQH